MARLGLPNIDIIFKELGTSAIERGESGVVAVILEDATMPSASVTHVYSALDFPEDLSTKNRILANLCLKGSAKSVKKLVLAVARTSIEGMNALVNVDYNYLVTPYVEGSKADEIVSIVGGLRENGKMVKYVTANKATDKPFVINFTTEGIKLEESTFTPLEFTTRIAGILASVPLSMSVTYQPLLDVLEVRNYNKAELEEAVGKGELVIYNDGRKVKIARGVTSLVTTGAEMPSGFRKIKILAIADLMKQDIRNTIEDYYIGKYPCDYDHKCLLISAINSYLGKLERDMLLDKGSRCEIDYEAQRLYLIGKGVDVNMMSFDEIIQANTGDKVFLKIYTKILDAIESVEIEVII